jgi:16S rRNA (guanine1516-N2)-methyltransferase
VPSLNTTRHLTALGLNVELIYQALPDDLTLSFEDGVLYVCEQQNPASRVFVDYVQGHTAFRANQHIGGENLIKACKIKSQTAVSVLDATCGMGKDSFLLAKSGFDVTAVERNRLVHALLTDGLFRFQLLTGNPGFTLHHKDSEQIMSDLFYDVIYLDPMFPAKVKSAKAKKDMQLFQIIHQKTEDNAAQLLTIALNSNCQKVVIKRPVNAPSLIDRKPTFQITGKTCRFDAFQLA